MRRCPCEQHAPAGPSTHRVAKHFDPRCPHSLLYRTTVQYTQPARPKPKRLPGVRRRVGQERPDPPRGRE